MSSACSTIAGPITLPLIEDVREGIHLQRYGGREPVMEFHRQIVEGFETLMADVREQTAERFERLRLVDAAIDLSAVGPAGSSSTWTYLVNDNPFSTLGLSMLASRNVGAAGAMGMLAVLYWPVTVVVAASVFVRRWLAEHGADQDCGPYRHTVGSDQCPPSAVLDSLNPPAGSTSGERFPG